MIILLNHQYLYEINNKRERDRVFVLISKSNWVRDELTFKAFDNDDTPKSPILLSNYMKTLEWQFKMNATGPTQWLLN